jgi:hypothetical protein
MWRNDLAHAEHSFQQFQPVVNHSCPCGAHPGAVLPFLGERARPRVQWPAPSPATFPQGKVARRARETTTDRRGRQSAHPDSESGRMLPGPLPFASTVSRCAHFCPRDAPNQGRPFCLFSHGHNVS